jgi:DNA-binding NarL/FixJ family response regulator
MNTPASPLGILIADDHPVVRMGVRNMLEAAPDFRVLAEAGDGNEALRQVNRVHPDVLLLDLSMPGTSGLDTLEALMSKRIEVKTVVLTASIEKPQILQALQLGARGIMTKNALPSELHACIRAVVGGQFWLLGTPVVNLVKLLQELAAETAPGAKKTFGLTPRELEITALVADGCTNKEIASICKISDETVKHHLKRIFDKTGVSSRLELAVFAMNHALTLSE